MSSHKQANPHRTFSFGCDDDEGEICDDDGGCGEDGGCDDGCGGGDGSCCLLLWLGSCIVKKYA